MGVLDRLRGRPREDAVSSPAEPPAQLELAASPDSDGESTSESDSESLSIPEMRGDFMLLPPMRPSFGRTATFGRSLDDFLTTHRPISVTTEPMAHDIEPERLGMMSARARRGGKPTSKLPAAELTHRQIPAEFDEEIVESAPAASPAPTRRLKASIPSPVQAARPDMSGQMPSVSHVHQAVRAPSMRYSPPSAPLAQSTPTVELEAVREASRMDSASTSPVIRPRGVGNIPGTPIAAPVSSTPLQVPVGNPRGGVADGDANIDLDALTAPSAADIPVISSPPRFRGAPPPQSPSSETSGTRPLLSLPSAPESPAPLPKSSDSPERETDLVHRTSGSSESDASAMSEPAVTSAGTMANPSQPRATRALLGDQPSVTAPPPPMFGGSAQVSTGSTGIQRKARTDSPPATPSVRSAAESSSINVQRKARAGTLPDAAPAPTAIPVPPEVRRAVTEAAGSAPDTALVHMGEHAHGQASALNAEAFTRDGEIFLAADAQLDTPRGQALLAHELTHVVQQQGQSLPIPDESTSKGRDHEQAAVNVERAIAEPPRATEPVDLHHAQGAQQTSGAEPVNVPPGVQRKARMNPSIQDDDRVSMPPTPALEPAHASVLQPTLKEQVDLVHAGKAPGVDQGAAAAVGIGGVQQPRPASAARPEAGTSLAVPMTVTTVTPSAITPAPVSQSGGGGSRGQSVAGSDTSEVSRPEPSALEKGIGYFSRMTSAPAAAPQDEESERGDLERQADSLYPLIRSRLRAELVRDLERRGRLTREWR